MSLGFPTAAPAPSPRCTVSLKVVRALGAGPPRPTQCSHSMDAEGQPLEKQATASRQGRSAPLVPQRPRDPHRAAEAHTCRGGAIACVVRPWQRTWPHRAQPALMSAIRRDHSFSTWGRPPPASPAKHSWLRGQNGEDGRNQASSALSGHSPGLQPPRHLNKAGRGPLNPSRPLPAAPGSLMKPRGPSRERTTNEGRCVWKIQAPQAPPLLPSANPFFLDFICS